MHETLRTFLQMDPATYRFTGFYIFVGAVLAAASWVFNARRPRGASPQRSGRASSPVVDAVSRLGRSFVAFIAGLPITPNQISGIGLLLVACNCISYIVFRNAFWFGSGLIAALLFDTLDGLVARAQGTSSSFGGYLDAMVDRYQEVAIYLSIGIVLDAWIAAFLIVTGSMMTSYAKARVALEMQTSNKGWNDLLEKPLRMVILCIGLLGAPVMDWFLPFALWMLAGLTQFTALQRFIRAYFRLRKLPA